MIKKILLNIKSFLLTITIFVLIISIIILNTIFNKEYIVNTLNKNNYYEITYNNLKETIGAYTIQAGIDGDVFKDLIKLEKVFNDINIIIDGIYDNKEIKIDTRVIGIELETIINNKLKENNRILVNEEKEAIKVFVDTVEKVYEDEIVYSTNLVLKIKEYMPRIRSFLINLINILLASIFIILMTILVINKDFKQSIRWVCISLFATSLLLITIWLLLRYEFQHILIVNLIFSKVLINIIDNIITKCLIYGVVIGIFSFFKIAYSSLDKE